MDLWEAMELRHSVRQYERKPLEAEVLSALWEEVELCNREGDLHIQLVVNEPKAFDWFLAHYGKFSGVTNYFAMVGKKSDDLDEKCGYYGERLVLKAQQLGLNTCWAAMSYRKVSNVFVVSSGEKLCIVIAVGYGVNQGVPHKSKPKSAVAKVAKSEESVPNWFKKGIKAAILAPTAVNQQNFLLMLKGNQVIAKAGRGICTKIDLGIVKYHFEIGAGRENFQWG